MKTYNIVIFGGGTGMSSILKGLKHLPQEYSITSVVPVTDDGGSSGRMVRRLKGIPPGDAIKCIAALSRLPNIFKKVFLYRLNIPFIQKLHGNTVGNLLFALTNFAIGATNAAMLFNYLFLVRGRVLPVSEKPRVLCAKLRDGTIKKEHLIDVATLGYVEEMFLEPNAIEVTDKVRKAVKEADLFVISAGDIYTSIVPIFKSKGLVEEVKANGSEVIYFCNLITKKAHTDGQTVLDHKNIIQRLTGIDISTTLYNTGVFYDFYVTKLAEEVEFVSISEVGSNSYGFDMLSTDVIKKEGSDVVVRSLARHSPKKVLGVFLQLLIRERGFACLALDFDRTLVPYNSNLGLYKKGEWRLYKDTEILKEKQPKPIALVTKYSWGDITFQENKVKYSGIKYDDLHLVNTDEKKAIAIKNLMKKYGEPVVLIDDKVEVLLYARKFLKNRGVHVFQMLRDDSKYNTENAIIPTIPNFGDFYKFVTRRE